MTLTDFKIEKDNAKAYWLSPTAARLRFRFKTVDAYEFRTYGRTVWHIDESGIEIFRENETRGFVAYSSFIQEGQPYEASIIDTGTGATIWQTSGLIALEPAVISTLPSGITEIPTDIAYAMPIESATITPTEAASVAATIAQPQNMLLIGAGVLMIAAIVIILIRRRK
jgi:hypothetical protein